MCVYTYIYIVIPEASGPQQLKLIRFQIYRDIPVTRPQYCLLRIHCMPLFIYIYISFSISTKSSLYPQHTMIFHVPIATCYTNQDIPFACTNIYIYPIGLWFIYHFSAIVYTIGFYVFIYIYIYRWLIVGLPFIYQYICIYHFTLYPQYTIIYTSVYHIGLPLAYTMYPQKKHNIIHCIPNIPLFIYIHQYITLAYHWLIHCIPKKILIIYYIVSPIHRYIYTSVYHIGLPLAYTSYPKKTWHTYIYIIIFYHYYYYFLLVLLLSVLFVYMFIIFY